jgi:tetratricopeptide (TPR) repeat protein
VTLAERFELKISRESLTSTKGILIIVSVLTLLSIIGLSVIVLLVSKRASESGQGIPVSFFKDLIESGGDEKKTRHLLRAELALLKAEMAQSKRNYLEAHSAFQETSDEFAEALGENTPGAAILMLRQAEFECDYYHYDIAEEVLRRALKGITSSGDATIILRTRQKLVQTLSYQTQAKLAEAIKLCLENIPLAEKQDITKQNTHHEELTYSLNWLAYCYSRHKEFDKAIETYEKLVTLLQNTPHEAPAKIEGPLIAAGQVELRQGHFEKAKEFFGRAIKANPSSSEPFSSRAHANADNHDYKAAALDYKEAIRLNPKSTWYWVSLADVYRQDHQFPQAIEAVNTVIKLHPKDPVNYSTRASIYTDSKQFDLAINDRDTVIDLGDKARQKAKGEAAIRADDEDAVEADEEYTGYIADRAQTYLQAGKYEAALADYNKVLTESPDATYWLRGRADCYDKLHQYQKEIDDLSNALKEENTRYDTLRKVASDQVKNDGQKEIQKKAAPAVVREPSQLIYLYDHRALAFEALGKKALAVSDRQTSAKLKSDWAKTAASRKNDADD